MRYAAHRHREPESRLADYLAEARALLATPPATPPPRRTAGHASTSAPTSSTCAGSGCPSEAAEELAVEGGSA